MSSYQPHFLLRALQPDLVRQRTKHPQQLLLIQKTLTILETRLPPLP